MLFISLERWTTAKPSARVQETACGGPEVGQRGAGGRKISSVRGWAYASPQLAAVDHPTRQLINSPYREVCIGVRWTKYNGFMKYEV
jgi:hypothetical protein